MKDSLALQTGQPAGGSVVKLSELPVLCLPVEPMMHLCKDISQLQHGYTLRRTVEMCGCAAPSGGLKALGSPAQRGAPRPGAHDHPGAVVVTLLQACHHGLAGDGAKLVGEGAVENQDIHGEDPLTDGCSVLQNEALMDEEDAA